MVAVGFAQGAIAASTLILWATAAYLLVLGVTAIVTTARTRIFLVGFAQTTSANLVEGGLRLLVGLTFIAASGRTRGPTVSLIIGWFLVVTAVAMLLLPSLHRRFAATTTSRVASVLPLVGIGSILLALALAWFIA